MKSKSFESRQGGFESVKENRSFDFVKLYKSAAETMAQFNSSGVTEAKKTNKIPGSELDASKRSRSPNKNKKKRGNLTLDSSNVINDVHSSSGTQTTNKATATSTPKAKENKSERNVKSIMKNSDAEVTTSVSKVSSSSSKPKKRNKSVSFMLEDADEVAVKKSKSNESAKEDKNKEKSIKKMNKDKKNRQPKQDNNKSNKTETKVSNESQNKQVKKEKNKEPSLLKTTSDGNVEEVVAKVKKTRKFKLPPKEEVKKTDDAIDDQNKTKKNKKKKRNAKALQDTNADTEDEPVLKSRKKELKPEIIAKGLENLNIGDNPFTLSSLLDEMTVVDKNKKKMHKQNQKHKTNKAVDTNAKQDELQDFAEVEKVKWSHRKWNKDTKGDGNKSSLQTSVVVDNLPIHIMCNYKSMLSENFAKFGTIIGIGVAETYPNEDPKPVFTTTVYFQDEDAATKALEEDNTVFKGTKNRIRVRRPLAPTQTTLVVRSFAELSQQALSSLFASAGRIRSIRTVVKGKKTIATAFVEFDGPEAVERALGLAENTRIGGKKMYAAKFEHRVHRKKETDGDDASIE